jgi:hypothetical protein
MHLPHKRILLLYPKSVNSRVCKQVLSDRIKKNLRICQCDSQEKLTAIVQRCSSHPYWFSNMDVMLTRECTRSEIWQLQAELRMKCDGAYGWIGQVLVCCSSNNAATDLRSLWPFSDEGGLVVLSPSTWLMASLTAIKSRRCLGQARWKECLENLPGLRVFWAGWSNALAAINTSDWMEARRCLATAIAPLIEAPNNELFLGHDNFRLLQRVYGTVYTSPNDLLLASIKILDQKLSSLKL